jgi:hypothetical protein
MRHVFSFKVWYSRYLCINHVVMGSKVQLKFCKTKQNSKNLPHHSVRFFASRSVPFRFFSLFCPHSDSGRFQPKQPRNLTEHTCLDATLLVPNESWHFDCGCFSYTFVRSVALSLKHFSLSERFFNAIKFVLLFVRLVCARPQRARYCTFQLISAHVAEKPILWTRPAILKRQTNNTKN